MTRSILLLLVEDEPLILLAAEDALEEGGYEVASAQDGPAGLDILEERAEALAGIIIDVRLPGGIDGWELARRARELKPNMPVVYCTADSGHEWTAQGVPKSLLVQKPYAPAQVVTAISSLITEAETAGQ